jgi:hypothetical protein
VAKKLKNLNGKKFNLENELNKFNLEHSVAGGLLRIDIRNHLDFNNVNLSNFKGDYLIHIEYVSEEKKYRFSAYSKKE